MERNSTKTLEIQDDFLEILGHDYDKLYKEDESHFSWDKQGELIRKFGMYRFYNEQLKSLNYLSKQGELISKFGMYNFYNKKLKSLS